MITFLLPFKGLANAKSRWSLPAEERELALLSLLRHNLETVASVVGAEQTVLVCPTPIPTSWRLPAVRHFLSPGRGLNGDLRHAREALGRTGRELPVAVLLPDLPRLQSCDVALMVQAASDREVVLCPDHHRIGTNGVVLNPGFALDFLFEGASFQRYGQAAEQLGRSTVILERDGLAHDADHDDDLRRISLL